VADLPHLNGYATAVCPLHNFNPAAAARNLICKRMVEEHLKDFDWLCMIDNDMVPPTNLLDTIKNCPPEAGIVVPEFSMFNQTEKKLTLCWSFEGYEGGGVKLSRGFHELTKCGTGVMFIRPSALLKIEYPYFHYVYDSDGVQIGTEDIAFCQKARMAAVRIFGNNRIRVGHYKSVDLNVLAEMLFDKKVLDAKQDKSVDFVPGTASPAAPPAETSPVEAR